MMSTLLVILTFSSGMPILYVIGFIFFFTTFVTNKLALFKYYQKTTTLSRFIPMTAMRFLNYALFFHLLSGMFMMTNPRIFVFQNQQGMRLPFIDEAFDALISLISEEE